MKVLKVISATVALLFLLLLLVLAYFTMTHGGMQRLFSLGQSYVQGELTWGSSTGALVGPAEITEIVYAGDDGTSVSIDDVQLEWQPRRLFRGQLLVDNMSVDGVIVRLPKPAPESSQSAAKEPFQLRDLRLPLATEIKEFSLTNIQIYPHGSETPIVIDSLLLGGGVRDSDLQLVELSASNPQGRIKLDGIVNTTGKWPASLTAVWQYEDAKLGPLEGRATVQGDIDTLELKHQLSGAVSADTDMTIKNVTGDLSWSGVTTAAIEDLGVVAPAMANLPLSVDAKMNGSVSDANIDGSLVSQHELTGPFEASFGIAANQAEIQIEQIDIQFDSSPASVAATGNVELATQLVNLDLKWSELSWPLQQLQQNQQQQASQQPPVIKNSQGDFKLQASADGVTVIGQATLEQDQAGPLDIAVDAVASPQQVTINQLAVNGTGTDTRLDVTGGYSIADNTVDLNGNWENLQWPLRANPADYASDSGQFSVVGPLDNYQLALSLKAGGAQVPEGEWNVAANGNMSELGSLQVNGETLGGSVNATGTAGWSPQPRWDIEISSQNINPESHWPGFEASVDVAVNSSGVVTADGLTQNTEIVDIGGTYKGQSLDGGGGVSVKDGKLVVDNLSLVAGGANISASGTIGSEVDLDWKLEAPSMQQLAPGFKGDLLVTGKHNGSPESMDSLVVIESAEFESDFIKIADLNGTASVDLSGKRDSDVQLSASDITLSGQDWDAFSLALDGTPAKHNLNVQLKGAQGKIQLLGDGSWLKEQWQGTIQDFSAVATAIGDWRLDQPVAVVASKTVANFSDLCISSEATSVCAQLDKAADGTVKANAVLKDLGMDKFRELLPPDIGVDLVINGNVNVAIDKDGGSTVDVNVGFPDGTLYYENEGAPVNNALGKGSVTALVVNDSVNAVVDIDLGQLGFVKANADLTTANKASQSADNADGAATRNGRIKGSLNSEFKDLSVFGIFAPALQSIDGTLKTNIAFAGDLASPRITGSASLQNLSVEVPSVALHVTDGELDVTGNGRGGLLLRGSARSGAGHLDIDGNYSAATGALEIGLAGENFRVSDTSRQRVDISPDLKIRVVGPELSITGDLLIPEAFIRTGGGSSVLVESPDVVIIDSNQERIVKQQSQINLDVQVALGDNVRVNAGQFDGAIGGGIAVKQQPGKVITGSGTIEVVSGDFLVYGQKLTMERGRVLFSGGPIDDPLLEIDVAREVPEYEVKAGARIRGSARTPILELQSEPVQTDANTLSFILLGKPIDALGASYTLGRYLTPDLYISYGFDLFDRRRTFNLRYRLSNRLSLIGSSSSSEKTGADLIYTLER